MNGDWEGLSGYGNCNNFVQYGVDGRIMDPTHGYWLSGRICPSCDAYMHTDGQQFKCMKCGKVIKFKKKAG